MYAALVVPPLFVDASRHQPCRVLPFESADCEAVDAQRRCRLAFQGTTILQPGYGGFRQRSTFARSDFFSQLRGFFRSVLTYGLSTSRPFSGCK
jgi:hypothetical protein